MGRSQHHERHFTASETVGDIVIGVSDGLTVPFAIAAGMTGAAFAARIMVTGGLAEIAAGSIWMEKLAMVAEEEAWESDVILRDFLMRFELGRSDDADPRRRCRGRLRECQVGCIVSQGRYPWHAGCRDGGWDGH